MGTVVDDRGVRRSTRYPSLFGFPASAAREHRKRVGREYREMFRAGQAKYALQALVFAMLLLVYSTLDQVLDWSYITWDRPMAWIAVRAVPGVVGASFLVSTSRFARRVIRSSFLQARVCFGCQYDLANLNACDDGCTVCPECGAAWKLGTATSPPIFESKSSE